MLRRGSSFPSLSCCPLLSSALCLPAAQDSSIPLLPLPRPCNWPACAPTSYRWASTCRIAYTPQPRRLRLAQSTPFNPRQLSHLSSHWSLHLNLYESARPSLWLPTEHFASWLIATCALCRAYGQGFLSSPKLPPHSLRSSGSRAHPTLPSGASACKGLLKYIHILCSISHS